MQANRLGFKFTLLVIQDWFRRYGIGVALLAAILLLIAAKYLHDGDPSPGDTARAAGFDKSWACSARDYRAFFCWKTRAPEAPAHAAPI